MTNTNFSQTAAFIWSVADLLRGDFKQSQYGRVILPFTLLRRLECVLESSKEAVIEKKKQVDTLKLPEEAQEKILLKATNGLAFFNSSPMDLGKMGQSDIKSNLDHYVQSFSTDAREIFEHFKFDEFVGLLDDANLLYKVVQKFATTDLSPKAISNFEMGLVFEELIRRFAESSNETAGEHFTPRDIVQLTTSLVFSNDDEALTGEGIVRTIYDPTAGTGGFLSAGMEYLNELNPNARMAAFGQELNPESYAICKADMLIKGQDVSRIKLGNTLSQDQLPADKFDYMLSNPPFGVDWKKIEGDIKDEHAVKGFDGRFGAGLPRVSDGSLLFLMHLISKMRQPQDKHSNGGRIGIILNGSPLFTGGAGSGESEIRRYILEADLLEAIIALPTDMFYNTGIATYVWILSNKKQPERKGKVQLIDGTNLYSKMRKSLGSKRNQMSDDDIKTITRAYGEFAQIEARELDKPAEQKSNRGRQASTAKTEAPKTFASKLFNSYQFGYRRLTIERPLRLSTQMTDKRVASLRFAPKPYNDIMQRLYEDYGTSWTDDNYGQLSEHETEIRAMIKADFPQLKEKQKKDVLSDKIWLFQKQLMEKAQQLQQELGDKKGGKYQQSDDFNQFDIDYKAALKALAIKLDAKEKKQLLTAITRKNPEAKRVVKKAIKKGETAQLLYGSFNYQGDVKNWQGKVVEYQPDGDLRDYENVPLNPNITTTELIENYFNKEVAPHVNDAWMNADKRDHQDKEIGIVGYEINFKSYFFAINRLDKVLSQKTLRIKNLVNQSKNGTYILECHTGKIIPYDSYIHNTLFAQIRFEVETDLLNVEYYNFFISQEEGKDWLGVINNGSIVTKVSFYSWINTRLTLPSISEQINIISLAEESASLIHKLKNLRKSILCDFKTAQEQILPFQNTTNRYENEFSSLLPTPLAILWELGESKFTDKERSESFIKFYEYLSYYLLSILFGANKTYVKKLKYNKNIEYRSLTMAFPYQRLKEYKNIKGEIDKFLQIIISDPVIDLLMKATEQRNNVAHRGLPSGREVKMVTKEINKFNNQLLNILRPFFDETCLIKPLKSSFDGEFYFYEVELLKGLGINPSKTKEIKTSKPLISNELYLTKNINSEDNEVICFELFPLLIADETIEDSEIMGFYFYSDIFESKLRYVCPYPNVATYKYKDKDLIMSKM